MNSNQKGINNPYYKHGESRTKLYVVWVNMKQRILNPKVKEFKYYGGRGITICNEWAENYIVFRDWSLSNGYQEGLEIDRIDNNGNYEPSNCRFVIDAKNCQNRRTNKLTQQIVNEINFKYNSGYFTQMQLAKEYNISQPQISSIINNKVWSK